MNKYENISEALSLVNMAFRRLMDLKDDLRAELKALLASEGVKDIDKIEDIEAYGKALIIEAQMEKLGTQAEELSGWIDNLIKIKI